MISRFAFQLLVFLAPSLLFHDKWNSATEAALTETPKSVVALLGTRVVLKCSTNISNIPIDWYFTAKDKSLPEKYKIYMNEVMTYKVSAIYSVDVSSRRTYSLVIKSLSWRNAGEYFCHDEAGLGALASATVTVLDPTPAGIALQIKIPGDDGSKGCHYVMDIKYSYYGDTAPTLLWNNGTRWNSTAADSSNTTTSPAATVPSDVLYRTITIDLRGRYNCSSCLLFCYFGGTGKSDEEDVLIDEAVLFENVESATAVSVVRCRKIKDPSLSGDKDSEFLLKRPSFEIFVTAVVLLSTVVLVLACCLRYHRKLLQDLKRNGSGRSFPLRYEFLRRHDDVTSSSPANQAAPVSSINVPETTDYRTPPQEPAYARLSPTRSRDDAPVDYRRAMKSAQQNARRSQV